MRSLYVCSNSEYSGKSLVCLGLGNRFRQDGLRFGYLKPLGKRPAVHEGTVTDQDALFFKGVFQLEEPLSAICPVVLTYELTIQGLKGAAGDLGNKVRQAYEEVSKGKDVVLIGGPGHLYDGAFINIPAIMLARELNTPVMIIEKYDGEVSIDSLLAARETLGPLFLGAVLNRVPEPALSHVAEMVVPFLEERGVPVLAAFPQDSLLDSVPVRMLVEALSGDVVTGEEGMEQLVERFSIGAMDVEHAIRHFAKTPNKAVITGGDRADIQLAALETSTRCLILTGGFAPNELILSKARTSGVPVVTVKVDTLTAVNQIEGLLGTVSIREERKVERIVELFARRFNMARLYAALGLKA